MRKVALLSAAVSLAACAPDAEPAASDSSDLTGVRPGGGIVIPGTADVVPGVDVTAEYAAGRRIETLNEVAWMTPDERAVVTRADGMLSSAPRDGVVSVDELAQLAAPTHIVVLSPAEKAALKTVWRFMKAPKAKEVPAMELPAAVRPLSPKAVYRAPTPIVRPAERTRFKLAESILDQSRPAAIRIQYGFDEDHDPSTIAIADIDAAILSPAFTKKEIAEFQALRATLTSFAVAEADTTRDATPRTMAAEVRDLPRGGGNEGASAKIALTEQASLRIGQSADFLERRQLSGSKLDVSIVCSHDWVYTIDAPGFTVVNLLTGDSPSEFVGPWVYPYREVLVELWSGGEPKARIHAPASPALPVTSTRPEVDLTHLYGHAFFTGNDLFDARNVIGHQAGDVITSTYRFSQEYYSTGVYEPAYYREQLNPEAERWLATGRYELPIAEGRTMRVDVYPEGAVLVSFGQDTAGIPAGTALPALPDRAGRRVVDKNGLRVTITSNSWARVADSASVQEGTMPPVTFDLDARYRTGW